MKRTGIFLGLVLSWTILFISVSAWSDSGKKLSAPSAVKNDVSIGANQKNPIGEEAKRGEKDLTEKGGAGVKKKAVKKAGVAAAAGVAGKKVMSTVGDSH